MSLTMKDVRRIASDVAEAEDPPLEVIAAAPSGSESSYAEIVLTVRGCRVEPCRVLIGVSRDISETRLRGVVRERLRRHLARHRTTGDAISGRSHGT